VSCPTSSHVKYPCKAHAVLVVKSRKKQSFALGKEVKELCMKCTETRNSGFFTDAMERIRIISASWRTLSRKPVSRRHYES
jgi:hypothetical protein